MKKGTNFMASAEAVQVEQMIRDSMGPIFKGEKQLTLEELRELLDNMGGQYPLPDGVKVEQVTVGNNYAEWISTASSAGDKVILYLHGGAYVIGSCKSHRDLAARLSIASGAKVLLIEYRLAPEHPFPAGLEDCVAAYRWLLDNGYTGNIAIGGDSAGGGMAMAVLVSIRDAGLPNPATGLLLSPWVDLAATGDSYQTRAAVDPMIGKDAIPSMVGMYIGDKDPRDFPLSSPLYADLKGLPPLKIQVGDHEVLLDEAKMLAEKAQAAGVEADIKVWDGMWHVFQQAAAVVPEAQEAVNELGAWAKSRFRG
jgi:epsilon-lactone hydrolase